ncbi:hypothetical protein HaLaN_14667 [Haematococcus lacustris]|uniref:Uncharacterized protein n=1 Tax=Haematococcus lacustris TaxID=44745 RepID=A0A699ZPX2_HAELA|nr:hypothetical protein HaLaN_14667 [Haematococcus lacustris]
MARLWHRRLRRLSEQRMGKSPQAAKRAGRSDTKDLTSRTSRSASFRKLSQRVGAARPISSPLSPRLWQSCLYFWVRAGLLQKCWLMFSTTLVSRCTLRCLSMTEAARLTRWAAQCTDALKGASCCRALTARPE